MDFNRDETESHSGLADRSGVAVLAGRLPSGRGFGLKRDTFVTIGSWIPRLLLAGVFVAAGIPKILDPAGFALAIFKYGLLPEALVQPAAIVLPWVELTIAIALLSAVRWRCAAELLSIVLLLTFMIAMLVAWSRGQDIHCGCFSTDPVSAAGLPWALGRDLLILGVAVMAFWFDLVALRRRGRRQ